MKGVEVIYGDLNFVDSFHAALDIVAREKIYIEMVEAPPVEKIRDIQSSLIAMNGPVFYAIDGEKVVGWCDVFPFKNPRLSHRGGLGMGVLPEYRGQGIGRKLLQKVIEHSRKIGLEKIELQVYTSNKGAISLYKKLGFVEEGCIKKYRRLDNVDFDCLNMAFFL